MAPPIRRLERLLQSPRKEVRLKATKLMLRHPDASPVQLVRCLCSEDNRRFEFLDEFGLGPAMRASWAKLRGVDDDEVYAFLEGQYQADPDANSHHVVHVLEQIGTQRTAGLLSRIRDTMDGGKRDRAERALKAMARPFGGDR